MQNIDNITEMTGKTQQIDEFIGGGGGGGGGE